MWGHLIRTEYTVPELERLVHGGQPIVNLDLSGLDLSGANLDGARFERCRFCNTDLRGCNLSEAMLRFCDFSHAEALDVCLADSLLEQCDFSWVRLAGSIVTDARFISCRFAGVSVMTLDWSGVGVMDHLTFCDEQDQIISFSCPRAVVHIEGHQMAFIEQSLVIDGAIQPELPATAECIQRVGDALDLLLASQGVEGMGSKIFGQNN